MQHAAPVDASVQFAAPLLARPVHVRLENVSLHAPEDSSGHLTSCPNKLRHAHGMCSVWWELAAMSEGNP